MNQFAAIPTEYRKIQALVAFHPVAVFVALAYAISWSFWLLMRLLDKDTANGLFIIGAAGPSLAAMIASAILRPEPSGVPAAKRWRLFGIAWIFALAVFALRRFWLAAGLATLAGSVASRAAYPTFVAFLLDALAAAIAAFVLSGIHSPQQGVRDLLHSLNLRQRPVRWYWYGIGVALYPGILVLGNAIAARLGVSAPQARTTGAWYWLALDMGLLFLYVLLGGGGLEEPGWRGFALPLLQKRYSPLRSSLILAVIWAFWHWPMFWFGYYGGGPFGVFFYALGVAPLAILLTAVFNGTGGSLPVVIVLHTSINITPMFLEPTTLANSLWFLLILVVAVWMWRSHQIFAPSKELSAAHNQ